MRRFQTYPVSLGWRFRPGSASFAPQSCCHPRREVSSLPYSPHARLITLSLLSALCLSGCSVSRKMAVGQMVPILDNTKEAALATSDLQLVEAGLPANILLLDGLIRTNPTNRELLAIGSFMQFGYALGILEGRDVELASEYYRKGFEYGLQSLEGAREFRGAAEKPLESWRRAVKELGRKQVEGMAWTCANWGRWIQLNLESPAAIAQQPRFEALLERLLSVDEEFEGGLPHVIRGMYDAMRPEMFGGQPDSARVHFERAFELSARKNKLYLQLYAESYCPQMLDEECFDSTLAEVLQDDDDAPSRVRLMNAMAVRRARALMLRRDELF